MREFTICTTCAGPAARELSEGLRPDAVCLPVKLAPRPSKLVTSVAGGREPGRVCSIAAVMGLWVTGGGGTVGEVGAAGGRGAPAAGGVGGGGGGSVSVESAGERSWCASRVTVACGFWAVTGMASAVRNAAMARGWSGERARAGMGGVYD